MRGHTYRKFAGIEEINYRAMSGGDQQGAQLRYSDNDQSGDDEDSESMTNNPQLFLNPHMSPQDCGHIGALVKTRRKVL